MMASPEMATREEGETPPSSFQDIAVIKRHLSVIAEMQSARPLPTNIVRTFATLQLDHGRTYPVGERTFAGGRMQPKMCYRNAGLLALDDASLTYVEGFTTTIGIPIEHAWCIDAEGEVIEPTLKPGGANAYFGVPFRTSFLRSELLRRMVWGIIDMNLQLLEMSEEDLLSLAVAVDR